MNKYELKDHLGNVRTVISDFKIPTTTRGTAPFIVDERAVNDYYPYGMLIPERSWSSSDYRYGYNTQEKSLEIDANGNHTTAEFWEYDARRAGRWNPDPVVKPWESSYATFGSNPILIKDPSGADAEDPIGPGYYQANVTSRMIAFGIWHPVTAISIGFPSKGSENISTVSVRFSTRIGLNENKEHEGSQVNAFRHVLWQAKITKEFGVNIAKQVGNLHEENAFAANGTNFKTSFSSLYKADEMIDLMNNEIGRSVGVANPNASMQELALKTLDYYKKIGLWTVNPITDTEGKITSYNISLTKLSQEQYNVAKSIILGLNSNGFTNSEQQKRDIEAKKDIEKQDKCPKF